MKTQKGQILIITLLVLTIVAIVTVSLVSLVNRDVEQVASTEQYEDAYNTSETQLKKVLDVYGKPGKSLTNIVTDFSSGEDINCRGVGTNFYTCDVTGDEFSTVELTTEITVKDTNKVTDFPIYKDRSFDMSLDGYLGTLNFAWDKNAAIEFELIYINTSTQEISSVRDVFDAGTPRIYNSLASDDPYDAASTIHPFKYKRVTGGNGITDVAITIADIVNLESKTIAALGVKPLTLKIMPRMADRFDSILLNVTAQNGGLPDQIREFTSKSYDVVGGDSTPVANIQTKVPLAAQPDSVLDSSIITNGILKNN